MIVAVAGIYGINRICRQSGKKNCRKTLLQNLTQSLSVMYCLRQTFVINNSLSLKK